MRFKLIIVFVFVLLSANCMSNGSPHKICSVADCINNAKSDISSAILCKVCMAKILSNHHTAILLHEIQWKMNHINRPNLADLNADVLLLIFDQLDILEIINLIKAYPSKQLTAVARYCFRKRYKDYVVHISTPTSAANKKEIEFDDESKIIHILEKTSAKILRYFGYAIENVRIQYLSTVIVEYLNKYTIDSLKKLTLMSIKKDAFVHLTKPFEKLEELSIHNKIADEHRPFNEIFPNIRKFSFRIYSKVDINFLLCEFLRLERFEIYYPFEAGNEELLEKFVRKNPQLQSLVINQLTPNMCSIINKHAPHLTNLTISTSDLSIKKNTIVEHVQHFRISRHNSGYVSEPLNKLTFLRLQSLSVVFLQISSVALKEFCKRHKNVSQITDLTLEGVYENQERLYELIRELPSLTEITLQHANIVNYRVIPGTIHAILERCENLTKLNLFAFHFGENESNNLRKQFENNWHIIVEYYRRDDQSFVNLSFDKKN